MCGSIQDLVRCNSCCRVGPESSLHHIALCFLGWILGMFHADPAQPLTMAGGEQLDDRDHDLCPR